MSVIVRQETTNHIFLFIKGADNAIEQRLTETDRHLFQMNYSNDVDRYSQQGLRTLVLAWKPISEDEFSNWKEKYETAQAEIHNREEKVWEVMSEIEREVQYLAITAVEDALQEEVQATIESIKEVGIRFWVLTGDKLGTAINIGLAC